MLDSFKSWLLIKELVYALPSLPSKKGPYAINIVAATQK